jgi:glycosyltransferase involved in cell wall biosynthesis
MLSLKPRILIFIDWFLPGYKAGGPVQSVINLIDNFKSEFDFWVITRNTDYCEVQPYENIKSDTWIKVNTYLKVYYASESKLSYIAMAKGAHEANPDYIFINGIYSLYFSILPLFISRQFKSAKVIVSARGMLTPSAINVKGNKKKVFLHLAKTIGLYKHICFHATNSLEEQHIQRLFGKKQQIIVAPNLPKDQIHSKSNVVKFSGILRLTSIARVSPEKNIKYALQVLQEYNFNGDIVFDIFGPIYDEVYWNECVELMKLLPKNVQATYRGSIEHSNVAETLQQYHALYLPTRGENFGHIIFESFAAGRPVIISDQTPWRNLEEQNIGYDISLDKPDDFAKYIQNMLNQSQEEYVKLTSAAYLYAQGIKQKKEAFEQNRLLFR